jgi:exonuclease III
MDFSIISLNVNGLNDDRKRIELFTWLNNLKPNIICLQETKAKEDNVDWWKKQWHGYSIWSCSGFSSGGTAVLIKDTEYEIVKIGKGFGEEDGFQGRVTDLTLQIQNELFRILSVYAPNIPNKRVQFFQKLKEYLNDEQPDDPYVFIAGDFNCIIDPKVDKRGGNPTLGTEGSKDLHTLISICQMEDWWRRRNPDATQTTWEKQQESGIVSTRIDRIYSPKDARHLIKDVYHFDCPYSDHKGIRMAIQVGKHINRGPGYWKLNAAVLESRETLCALHRIVDDVSKDHWSLQDWDDLKLAMKSQLILEAEAKQKADRIEENTEKHILRDLQRKYILNPGRREFEEDYLKQKEKVIELQKSKIRGQLIRSRERYLVNGELPKGAWLKRNLKKVKNNLVGSLKSDGVSYQDPNDLVSLTKTFYETLYRDDPETAETKLAQEEILKFSKSQVPHLVQLKLDQPITLAEVLTAIKSTKKNKSPGLDGLTAEFYHSMSAKIAPLMLRTFQKAYEEGHLSESQRSGLITTIFKKGDPEELKNYRPISLLNVDAKILSKILANRLKLAMKYIIHVDQKCISSRFILENSRQILDLIAYIEAKKLNAALVFLDQEKAFDRVRWSFLHRTLENFGFGPVFRRWIETVYRDSQSQVRVNDFISTPFKLGRGVRQGDPLSPLLYVITIEAVANAIRENPDFVGVLLPGLPETHAKVSLYADDTTIYASSIQDLNVLKSILDLYGKASGAKVNFTKSEGILFRLPKPPDEEFTLSWVQNLTSLGIKVGKNISQEDVWEPLLIQIQKTASGLSKRKLTIKGRVHAVKTFILSKLRYTANVYCIGKEYRAKFEKIMWEFIWEGKPRGRISRDIMMQPTEMGGLAVPHFESVLKAIQIQWVKRLTSEYPAFHSPWTRLANFFVNNFASEEGLGLSILFSKVKTDARNICPQWWIDCIHATQGLCNKTPDLTPEQVLSMPLLHKDFSRKRSLDFSRNGIIRIGDLWMENRWATRDDINNATVLKLNHEEFDKMLSEIPTSYKDEIERTKPQVYEWNQLPFDMGINLPLKKIYEKLCATTPAAICKSAIRWNQKTDHLLPWKKIWKRAWPSYVPRKWNQTYFFLLHQAHYTGTRASNQGDPRVPLLCEQCGDAETNDHIFHACKTAKWIWKAVKAILAEREGITLRVNLRFVIEGNSIDTSKKSHNQFLTKTHRAAVHLCWVARCERVYGNGTNEEELKNKLREMIE